MKRANLRYTGAEATRRGNKVSLTITLVVQAGTKVSITHVWPDGKHEFIDRGAAEVFIKEEYPGGGITPKLMLTQKLHAEVIDQVHSEIKVFVNGKCVETLPIVDAEPMAS